jgi:phage gpG-like protein
MPSNDAISYDTRQTKKITLVLKRLQKEGIKVEKPLKRFGVYHVSQTIKGFNKGGRSKKWKKLSKVTIAIRKHRGISGIRPLVATGAGKRSIQTTVLKYKSGVASSTFTRLKYMAIHQTGGRAKRPMRPNQKKPAGYMTIPQRKYLEHTNADVRKAVQLLVAHEKQAIQKSGLKRRVS